MGLDVYLHELAHAEQDERHYAEWEALWQRKERGEITEGEFDEYVKDITPHVSPSDVPSETDPDHLFNRRYLRSSYNAGGFDRAVPDYLGEPKTLYWIFEPLGVDLDTYEHNLNGGSSDKLTACKSRALEVADDLAMLSVPLRVTSLDAVPMSGPAEHLWQKPATGDDALAWYRGEAAKRDEDGWWTSARGEFFATPHGNALEAVGAVPGRDILNRPCVHLIYRDNREQVEWYEKAARITAEFCDEAIALIERDGSVKMTWSG